MDRPGFEPGTEACKATVFPTIPTAHVMATPKGFEPLTFGFGDQRSAGLNYGAITHSYECEYQNTLREHALIRSDFFVYKNTSHPRGRPFAVLSVAGSRCLAL